MAATKEETKVRQVRVLMAMVLKKQGYSPNTPVPRPGATQIKETLEQCINGRKYQTLITAGPNGIAEPR